MTPDLSTHLSEEALDDVLIGLGSPELEAHAACCPECRAKLEAFRSHMRWFNSASLAWSETRTETRSETKPAQLRQTVHHGAGSRMLVAFVGWGLLAAALLLTAVTTWRHHPEARPGQANTVLSQPVDSEAQIAQDNQLLEAVNVAISPDDESPIDEYNLSESPHTHPKAHPKMRMK